MDTKILFLIGVMILILSTCSINPNSAESGNDGQAKTVTVCSTSQQVEGCLVHLP
ncbi:MAG TPA: hypothetical protein VFC02_00915 [Anaerolineales bacterium]|jgi:hypothetical protein|nr:hypothetical protein [Anaerolineales bacterium]